MWRNEFGEDTNKKLLAGIEVHRQKTLKFVKDNGKDIASDVATPSAGMKIVHKLKAFYS